VSESDLTVSGFVVGIESDSGEGAYLRVRVTTEDAEALARAGAFGRTVRIQVSRFEPGTLADVFSREKPSLG